MNLLGIDFEDWFHPELIQRHITGKNNKPTVVQGIDKILEWLRKNDTFATFFMVGELLESKPELLDKILDNGHEIAFHTMYHTRLDTPNFKEKFTEEIKKFAELTKGKSRGFRAPTFSLNESSAWLIDVLVDNNYLYDSSVVPVKTNMYGIPNAETKPYKITSKSLEKNDPDGKILEFPLLVTKFLGKKIPAAGGFYLRTLPMKVIKNAIQNYEKDDIPACFYIHSWELTPEFMPRLQLPFKDSFITYHNIEKTLERMNEIISNFQFTSFNRFIDNMK
ncbi:MAG: xylanase [Nitrosarchaeum sp.]|nr:MAG: xylanase [Nitrosarchaeum sp.]